MTKSIVHRYKKTKSRRKKQSLSTSGMEAGLFRPFPAPVFSVNGAPAVSHGRYQAVRHTGSTVIEAIDNEKLIYCGF